MKRTGSLNHVFRLIWSDVLGCWIAVSEITRGRGKGTSRKLTRLAAALAAATAALAVPLELAQAAPLGGQVTAGTGTIAQTGSTTTINQTSQNLSLGWKSFNVGVPETVNFVQPSASAIAVNRIADTNASQILGNLNANGQVFLINPNGIVFGQGAQVNVGGLVASTLDTADASLNNATRSFSGSGTGSIVNKGRLTAANGGYIALLGQNVSNQGVITAQLGSVIMGAGSTATLTFQGTGLASLKIDQSVLETLVDNGGLLQADGGMVIMNAGAQHALLASVVNNTGVIEARTLQDHNGTITLLGNMSAGVVNVGGTLDASAPNGGNGGFIETSAAQVKVADSAVITTLASGGNTGTWLIDPTDYTIAASGGNITGAALSAGLTKNAVTILSAMGSMAGAGDITVNDTVTWSANKLTLSAQNNITINTAMNGSGSAQLALLYGQNLPPSSNTSTYNVNVPVNLPAGANFSTTQGLNGVPVNYTVLTSLGVAGSTTQTDLQGMTGAVSGNYALGANIDATSTAGWNGGAGFAKIGGPGNGSSSHFDGLGHVVSNLTINQPGGSYVGMFGITNSNAVIQNVGLVGANVTASGYSGALTGWNMGTIKNSFVAGKFLGAGPSSGPIGLLVGYNQGSILNSYASGIVNGLDNNSGNVGGLVGDNPGSISNSYATGSVSGYNNVGGLAGGSSGKISSSYAAASVSGHQNLGGLLGTIDTSGTIDASYAVGSVTVGAINAGGLVGSTRSTNTQNITNSYWNTDTSGQKSSQGGTGLITVQMQNATNFVGFTFTTLPGQLNSWVMVNADGSLNTGSSGAVGATYPMLASEYSTSISNAHQLQLMAMAPSAAYTLAANIDAWGTAIQTAVPATPVKTDVWINTTNKGPSGRSGFVPVGNTTTPFTGTFDGLNHTINNLTITTFADNVGLFGVTGSGAALQNVGLTNASVYGGNNVGTLAGNNAGTISNSYATGASNGVWGVGGLVGVSQGAINNSYASSNVTGTTWDTGGLLGHGNGANTVSNSYATGSVSGKQSVGGLLGYTAGTLSNSYASGKVQGTQSVGGLAGFIDGSKISNAYATGNVSGVSEVGGLVGHAHNVPSSIANSYATGSVSGSSSVGGLIGVALDGNRISNSFWNTGTSGQMFSSGGGTGLTTAQIQSQASFAGWDFANTWILYAGQTSPLLRSFMTPLTVTANSATKVYDGLAYNGASGVTYSMASDSTLLKGSLTYGSAINAGNYSLTPAGLYSTQQGYLISYVPSSLSITAQTLTAKAVAADKVYDGSTKASATVLTLAGLIPGESITATGLATFDSPNVTSASIVTVNSVTLANGTGGLASNYRLDSGETAVAHITPAALTATVVATDKMYDGKVTANASVLMITGGLVSGESLTVSGTSTFDSPNVTSASKVTVSNVTLADGTKGLASNYRLASGQTATAHITPAILTATAVATDKVYDGSDLANAPVLTMTAGVVKDETITATGTGTFNNQNVTSNNAVTVQSVTLSGGTNGLASNYSLASGQTAAAQVTAKALTATAVATDKVYDGTTVATAPVLTLTGLVSGESITATATGTFNSRNVTSGNAVTVNSVTLADGVKGLASNYSLASGQAAAAKITPAPLDLTATTATKVYDGNVSAAGTVSVTGLAGKTDSVSATQSFGIKDVLGVGVSTLSVNGYTVSDGNNGNNYKVLTHTAPGTITRLDSVNWTGGTTGNWSLASNWAGSAIPDLANVANVVIPAGTTVTFDASVGALKGAVQLVSVTGGALKTTSGTLKVDNALTTDGYVQTGGLVSVGTLNVNATGDVLLGNILSAGPITVAGNAITVAAPVSWNTGASALTAQTSIDFNAPLSGTTSHASLALNYGQNHVAAGNTASYNVNAGGPVNLMAGNNFSTRLGNDGTTTAFTVLGNDDVALAQLQAFKEAPSQHFVLGSNMDASATSTWNSGAGFVPIGTLDASFTGIFDGLGHTLTNLTINLPGIANTGLFGVAGPGSVIQNVGLVGGNITGGAATGALVGNNGTGTVFNSYASAGITGGAGSGGLVGTNTSGTISKSYATGSVAGGAGSGGLLGTNTSGAILGSYATGNVTGAAGSGGLLGSNTTGTVQDSHATGSVDGAAGSGGLIGSTTTGAISNNYASGNVTGAAGTGGLIGSNTSGNISNSSATGNVVGAAGAGGLVGSNTSGGITNDYATGTVVGAAGTGGLLGSSTSGMVTNSYWNTTTSNVTTSVGGEGKTTEELSALIPSMQVSQAPR